MGRPEYEAAYLIETYNCIKALEIATARLDAATDQPREVDRWNTLAIRCYILGFNSAIGLEVKMPADPRLLPWRS